MRPQSSPPKTENGIRINQAQLVLTKNRTHQAMLRTGIAILALSMALVSFLVATSRFHRVADVNALNLQHSLLSRLMD